MPNSQEIEARSNSPVPQGYVLGASEGEHLIHFRASPRLAVVGCGLTRAGALKSRTQ